VKKLLVAIVAALAAPAGSQAADYVGLTVNRTAVAPGWALTATHTSGAFYRGDEIFGLTLTRSFLGGRGQEQHRLVHHPRQPLISFDGRAGRWQTKGRLGSVAAIDMTITATGTPSPADFAWGCTGAFVRVPVRLRGSLTLRTGTTFFRTIRRASLTGFVTYEDGTVTCERPAPLTCESSTALFAGGGRASLNVAPRNFSLQFREAAGPATWYHVMTVGGYEALTGSLPTIDVRAPSAAISGGARFTGETETELTYGACRTTRTAGAATGSFRTTFAGWGARTLRLGAGASASYSQTS
jgi:hypothetical protein